MNTILWLAATPGIILGIIYISWVMVSRFPTDAEREKMEQEDKAKKYRADAERRVRTERGRRQRAAKERQQQAGRERQQRADHERREQADREKRERAGRERQRRADKERQQRAGDKRQQRADKEERERAERKRREQATRERQQRAHEERQQQDQATSSSDKNEKYHGAVLGLKGKISKSEIKKRYRALSVQYHPDKVEHLGPKLKAVAVEEMQKINEAYEYFKKRYSF